MSTTINTFFEDQQQSVGTPDINDLEKHYVDAKAYILSTTTKDGLNLYDHLAHCISRLLADQPQEGADMFEEISKNIKGESTRPQQDTLRDRPAQDTEHILAEEQKPLFQKTDHTEELDDEALQSPLPYILEQAYYFEQSGIGLGKDESYRIWLSLKQLVDKGHIEKIRFWGKLFGTQKNYYVAEVEQSVEEGGDDEDRNNDEINKPDETKENNEEDIEGEEDPLPKSTFKSPPVVPKEERGTGVNKSTYYVCNHPGAPWIKLPTVTPAQITQARLIKHFFTGDLNKEIISYPAYPGTEKNYLRAQIARISAATHISPAGKFRFSEEEEEEEEGGRENYQDNEDFKGAALIELVDEELNGWVHHAQYVLPQGRTKWWNPTENIEKDEEDEDEDEEEMKAEAEEIEPEQGPPLLTPIGADAEIESTKAWTAKISSNLIPQYACAIIRSNLWPGAYAFARGMAWENIYIGFGHKYVTTDYGPELPPLPANEYNDGPEIAEADDPLPEDEAKAKAAEEQAAGEEEEEEEEEENEEEEDDN
ncbi:unnamed protein product [Adineta steineri]|uniref:Uncharacterized protein n=1 Tax=Adineta steineri TaxID=433720 RepID=A0A818Z4Y9_9BILA|nr:unnamed protein product [Adineta steineri]